MELTDDPPKAAKKNDMALGLIEYSCFWFQAGLNETLGFGYVFYFRQNSLGCFGSNMHTPQK